MKLYSLVFAILFITTSVHSQVTENDSIKGKEVKKFYDTIANVPIELEEVYISNKYSINSADERKKFLLLQRRVVKVYPYAKISAERLNELNEGMEKLTSSRDKKKYFKMVENYLTTEFEAQLKKLTRKEGQILVKLIHRQTGKSTFDLIKELKSGWKAFWSNNTARLFDINLKAKYDPYNISEDFIIEGILFKAFSDGRLIKQAPKVAMNYSDLAKIWREKIKDRKEARENQD
jgi:hypothetical protein